MGFSESRISTRAPSRYSLPTSPASQLFAESLMLSSRRRFMGLSVFDQNVLMRELPTHLNILLIGMK